MINGHDKVYFIQVLDFTAVKFQYVIFRVTTPHSDIVGYQCCRGLWIFMCFIHKIHKMNNS